MKITLSVIKADIGSIGGHIGPSRKLLDAVKAHVAERGRESLLLPMGELEYTGITEKLAALDKAFRIRPAVVRTDAAA